MTNAAPHLYFCSALDKAEDWRSALAAHLPAFKMSVEGDDYDPATVDVALVWTIPDGLLARFSDLKAVLSLGAGVNQIDPSQIPAHVPLARLVDETLTRTMVDYAKAVVYRYHRCLDQFEKASNDARWMFIAPKATSETFVAILGLGQLGRAIAFALRDEGFRVGGWSRSAQPLAGIETFAERHGLTTLVSRADIVINVLPLTRHTTHILCGELFQYFRRGSRLVNIGRGQHLVEDDLLQAISAGILSGATLDVTAVEPLPPSHPFWHHPDILVTPHVAGLSSPTSAAPMVAHNIRRAMTGQVLLNQVDLARGY
jgi:glyoxylate/hydroxypyruvate reductase A